MVELLKDIKVMATSLKDHIFKIECGPDLLMPRRKYFQVLTKKFLQRDLTLMSGLG
jgi:hypothetical protein